MVSQWLTEEVTVAPTLEILFNSLDQLLMSTKYPLISVIVPCYNHAKYVSDALDSIFDQSYSNIELIVIDDKSTDSTLKVINKWISNLESKTRFIDLQVLSHSQNLGAASTLNEGLEHAKGELITFLNSDDFYDSQRLERFNAAYNGEEYFCGFSEVKCVSEKNSKVDIGLISIIESIPDRLESLFSNFLMLQDENIAVTSGNIVISRGLAQRLEKFKNLLYCHDWEFLIRAAKYCEITFIRDSIYYYRLHGENSFRDLSDQADFETEIVRSSLKGILRQCDEGPGMTQWDLMMHGVL